jgi:hypothetical protein
MRIYEGTYDGLFHPYRIPLWREYPHNGGLSDGCSNFDVDVAE